MDQVNQDRRPPLRVVERTGNVIRIERIDETPPEPPATSALAIARAA